MDINHKVLDDDERRKKKYENREKKTQLMYL